MVVLGRDSFIWLEGSKQSAGLKSVSKKVISLISSFSNFLTSSPLVRFFRLTAPAAVLGHLGAISLKKLTKRKEVRKGADQANSQLNTYKS